MRFTVENTVRIGYPVRVFDANGDEIRYVLEADDVTGECTVFRTRTDRDRGPLVTAKLELSKRRIICKPPLQIIQEFV